MADSSAEIIHDSDSETVISVEESEDDGHMSVAGDARDIVIGLASNLLEAAKRLNYSKIKEIINKGFEIDMPLTETGQALLPLLCTFTKEKFST